MLQLVQLVDVQFMLGTMRSNCKYVIHINEHDCNMYFCIYDDFTVISQATTILIFLRSWFSLMVQFSELNYLEGLPVTLSLLIQQEMGLGLFYLTLIISMIFLKLFLT